MQIHGPDAALRLAAEQSLRIASRSAIEIVCLDGLLWVTQPGDPRDLFVAPGAPLRLSPSGLTLVTALRSAVLRVREVHAVAGARGWRRRLSSVLELPGSPPVLQLASHPGRAPRRDSLPSV